MTTGPSASSGAGSMAGQWAGRDLLGLRGLARGEIVELLQEARRVEGDASGSRDALRGVVVANLFFEDSTRTRVSFSIAAQRLGAHVVDLGSGGSSVSKGESILDTALTIEAMGAGAMVVRARQGGAPHLVADAVGCPVVNAGDGRHEHPTQGLLDIFALAEAHGRADDFDLSGLHVAIVGDVGASRVARSAVAGMTALGARVTCVGPSHMAGAGLASLGCEVSHDLDSVLGLVDGLMMLRVQFERRDGSGPADLPSVREYRTGFALTSERAGRLKAGAVILHPGPMNRGLEIDGAVADGPQSVIRRQVALGVAVRMAVLKSLVLPRDC